MTDVHHFLRFIQVQTQIDHLVPCISSYPFILQSHFSNYTLLSSTFCAIPLCTNYMVFVHQGMPWLRAKTMTCLPTRAIMRFWPKSIFLQKQSNLLQLDLKQIMKGPFSFVVCTDSRLVPCLCSIFLNFAFFTFLEASHQNARTRTTNHNFGFKIE